MDRDTNLNLKKIYSIAIRQHLEKSNWEKLEEILSNAEPLGVTKELLKKGWMELGRQQKKKDNLVSALVSFASARKHDIDNNQILGEIIECLTGFIDLFESKFSREDLIHLEYSLDRVYRFQKTRSKTSDVNLQRAKELLARIRSVKENSVSKRETVATSNVLRIYLALFPGMTPEEVRIEFARIAAPLVRKKLAENEEKRKQPKHSPKKRRRKKKPNK